MTTYNYYLVSGSWPPKVSSVDAWGTEHRIGARCCGVDGGYPTNDSSIFPRIYTTICQCSEFSVGDRPKIAIYGVAGHPLLYAVAAP